MRPFVGRAQELADLASALEEATSGRGSLVLLTGEPGIGKTRLMAELAQVADRRGVRVASGRCWEAGGAPPYWPWMQVVRSVGGDFERLAASGGGAMSSGVVPETERIRLFDAVGCFLVAASRAHPLLVTLDDVHAADEPSLLLLRFVGDAFADANVLLVASYREAERRVRELGDLFGELARVGRRMALRGLTSAEVEAYVAAVTGARPTRHTVARLHRITAGNPFFVGEIVRILVAEGSVTSLDGSSQDPFLRIPEEVRALVRRRVATLSREAVAALRVAAVVGREFDLHLLRRMIPLGAPRLLEVLREAARLGVVNELAGAARYAFAHELVRETLYDDLPPGRRLELHREVGHLLETAYGDDVEPHLSEIARHLYLAAPLGEADQALEYLLRAGDRARALLAYEEAADHYGHALELLAAAGDASGERRWQLLMRLGDAQWRSGDAVQARTIFEDAIDVARRLPEAERLAEAALGYVTALGGFLLYARFEVGASGVGLLEEALAALPPEDSALRAQLLAHLALEMWSGNELIERRVAISEQAMAMASRLGDAEALVMALHARHWALTTPGRARERLAHAEEMLRMARERTNPELEFLAHNARFHCLLELCDRRGMDASSEAMAEIAERLRQPFYRWHTVCLRALRATLDGRFTEAERLAREALELGRLRQSEYAGFVFRYAQMLALRWAQGRLHEWWPEIDDHAQRFPWIPRWREPFAAAELRDAEAARRELELQGARGFVDLPRDGLWLLHVCSLADACVLVGDRSRAPTLYELLLPHADENAVSYSQQPFGPVALRLGKLAAALGRATDADRHFAQALARCDLLGAPAIRARVLLEYAQALADREPARREALLAEAGQICAQLGMTELSERVDALRARGDAAPAGAIFRREGEFWTIAYAGRTVRLRDVKGLAYIAALLASPGGEIHALELAGGPAAGDLGGHEPVLDRRAKQDYARRLAELEDELAETRAWADPERAARVEAERDAVTRELGRALGLRGHDRAFASPAERARISVTKAIKTAIRLIGTHSPELAAHLQASIRTGRFCSYAPRGVSAPCWSLSPAAEQSFRPGSRLQR